MQHDRIDRFNGRLMKIGDHVILFDGDNQLVIVMSFYPGDCVELFEYKHYDSNIQGSYPVRDISRNVTEQLNDLEEI